MRTTLLLLENIAKKKYISIKQDLEIVKSSTPRSNNQVKTLRSKSTDTIKQILMNEMRD